MLSIFLDLQSFNLPSLGNTSIILLKLRIIFKIWTNQLSSLSRSRLASRYRAIRNSFLKDGCVCYGKKIDCQRNRSRD
jgi:hypothetical protein